MVATEDKKDLNVRHVGRELSQTSQQINRALDSCIALMVSPELTGVRCFVLGYIVRMHRGGQPIYQRDLERRFQVRRSSVTAMLKSMESAGFISRAPVQQDARLKSLAPTGKGVACYDQMVRCIEAFETHLLQDVDETELEMLQTVLGKLQSNAHTAAGALAGPEQKT